MKFSFLFLFVTVFFAGIAEAQTRFYLPNSTAADMTAGAFDGGWEGTSEATRKKMFTSKQTVAIAVGTQTGQWANSTTHDELDVQWVSAALDAQTIDGTVKLQAATREFNNADNVDQIILKIWVAQPDGSSRGTLLAIGSYGTAAEFINNLTHRNKTGADGDTLSSVAAQAGDFLVVEYGYRAGIATPSTPEAATKWGDDATDCPEDETTTTNCAPWIEFSDTITFSAVSSAVPQLRNSDM